MYHKYLYFVKVVSQEAKMIDIFWTEGVVPLSIGVCCN